MARKGYRVPLCDSLNGAIGLILRMLYPYPLAFAMPVSDKRPTKTDRNQEIYDRYSPRERAANLAQEFGVSVRRINRLINRLKGRKS